MPRSLVGFAWIAILIFAPVQEAAEYKLIPESFVLTGPQAIQRVLAVDCDGSRVIADVTAATRFNSSNPKIASIDASGIVTAQSDGETIVTASRNGRDAVARVKVTGSHNPVVWSFRNHIIPLLTKNGCNSGACHGALAGKGGFKLSLRGYDPETDYFVMTRQAQGRRVDQQQVEKSLILQKTTRALPHGGGKRFGKDSEEYKRLSEWIRAAAQGPSDKDIHLERLEVLPAAATLKQDSGLQLVVRALYSDGHAEDVTRWAKYLSSEDQVASVDADGRVKVMGSGEASVSVLYSGHVASALVASPFVNSLGSAVYAQATRTNYIDDLILKKLEALRLPSSPACTDSEFIRRAYLDAAGILPTEEEVKKFLEDKSPDKRSRFIDSLLERPEFIDYWAYKWSDLMLISTRKLPQAGVWAFYQFVRQSVADNKPWNRFAREILTAKGNSQANGAVNYFILHKDVSELSEATSVTFMGMSITCCRCHNHPLEKWTQDQYWSMANLFSRVAYKNGDHNGEIIVQPLPSGDVAHPRRGIPMPPAPLEASPLAVEDERDRREYFADWLLAPENPYFAPALVNRVWRNFMGRGLVESEDDFRQTNPATHPDLLDRLAKDFVDHNYDVKAMIRLIMNSATYQRSSKPLPENAADDRYYSHYLIRRLSAEVLLDAYSQATGVPTVFNEVHVGSSGGTAGTGQYPMGTRALQLPDSLLVSPFLDSFGRPLREQTCSCERLQDSSITQALHLNNGKTLNDKLRDKNSIVEKWLGGKVSDSDVIRRLFLIALCREPTPGEIKKFSAVLVATGGDRPASRREVLEDICWAVLTGKEFVFNH